MRGEVWLLISELLLCVCAVEKREVIRAPKSEWGKNKREIREEQAEGDGAGDEFA